MTLERLEEKRYSYSILAVKRYYGGDHRFGRLDDLSFLARGAMGYPRTDAAKAGCSGHTDPGFPGTAATDRY